jgi:hypothetical protein
MPERSPIKNNKPARSLGIALGVDEYIYLAGLCSLAAGSFLRWSLDGALISIGVCLVVTSLINSLADRGVVE